jgi:long-chain acyl-CoA synthetase
VAPWLPELEDIERQYLQSPCVKEICVLRVSNDDAAAAESFYAVVVPDMEWMRRRRIINIGDLLRFEMDGQSIHLPPSHQVRGFEIWFETLPRAASGALKRADIERRLRSNRETRAARAGSGGATEWARNGRDREVIRAIARRTDQRLIDPDSNLEIDLGLDSMARVELVVELEHRLGLRLPRERAHDVLTVSQLLETLEPIAVVGEAAAGEDSWALLLRHLPPASDPLVRPLLERHFLKSVFYLFLRALRLVIAPIRVAGLEHVPRRGAFILTPNHQSYLDPFFICAILPYRVVRDLFAVGATEYFETPVMAWIARQLNLVRLDPDGNLVPAMRAAAFGLQRGRILMLFPEGERSIDGRVKRFKKGAPVLSRHLDVPIVPVAIRGMFELWPRNRPFNWRMLLPWSRHCIEITFGPPVALARDLTYAAAAAMLQQRVSDLWESPQERSHGQGAGDAARQKDG